LQYPDHTVAADAGPYLKPKVGEPTSEEACGTRLFAGELWVLVQVAPEDDERRLLAAERGVDLRIERGGLSFEWKGGQQCSDDE